MMTASYFLLGSEFSVSLMNSSQSSKVSLGFLILFAVTGQFFMAQADRPYTFWMGLFFYGLALWELKSFFSPLGTFWRPLSIKTESLFLVLILGLACFFRLYRIDILPVGMHTDQGLTGLCALRIEHEGWRPFFEIFNYQIPEVLLFYQLAAWFRLAGDSLFNFHLFFTLQALFAFIFFYATIRQLSGSKTALFSLFILAVTRWSWIETRTGYPSSEVIFYLFGAMCFWVYGLQKRKIWAFILSAFFMGMGLYTYQAFKLVPLIFLIYAAVEYSRYRKGDSFRFSTIIYYFLIVFVLALPLLHYFWQEKTLGNRERDVFIGNTLLEQKSLRPLWDVWVGNALMFNRTGDEIARHNIPGHRMLDDVTGVLFILGLGLAFCRRKDRDSFYLLTGFFVLALAGLLSNQPNNSNRLVVLTAFTAYFAGSFLEYLWNYLELVFRFRKKWIIAVLLIGLTAMTAQNGYIYFVEQANNEDCRLSLGLEQATIGQTIGDLQKASPGRFHFFITPFYFDNHVVRFLGYQGMAESSPLNLTALAKGDFPKDKDAVFFMEQNKGASFDFLKMLFPDGHETLLKNSEGHVLLYRYDVPLDSLRRFKKWNRGLAGTYWNAPDAKDSPVLSRQDPVLNFTSKLDLPFQNYPPFFIRWKGRLITETGGTYRIRLLTTDKALIKVDGREVFNTEKAEEESVSMKKGFNSIQVEYKKMEGDLISIHLVWMIPGQNQWEVVPPTAFGPLSSR
jgi:hypothetical protein